MPHIDDPTFSTIRDKTQSDWRDAQRRWDDISQLLKGIRSESITDWHKHAIEQARRAIEALTIQQIDAAIRDIFSLTNGDHYGVIRATYEQKQQRKNERQTKRKIPTPSN